MVFQLVGAMNFASSEAFSGELSVFFLLLRVSFLVLSVSNYKCPFLITISTQTEMLFNVINNCVPSDHYSFYVRNWFLRRFFL